VPDKRKRIYRDVTVAGGSGGSSLDGSGVGGLDASGDGYRVLLDGRDVRTPAGAVLRLPTRDLAEAVAAEWRAQDKTIEPDRMPLTALAVTAIDRAGAERAAVDAALTRYAATDLVCYWADAPDDLVQLQRHTWLPLLDWAREACGARLRVTAGVVPVQQDAAAVDALGRAVARLSGLELGALCSAVAASGSLVVGLALVRGRICAADAYAAALLDERFQAERWGEDAEAGRRRLRLRDDLGAVERFLCLGRAAAPNRERDFRNDSGQDAGRR
jgi:chaperone required for assembly of F1-ATPase